MFENIDPRMAGGGLAATIGGVAVRQHQRAQTLIRGHQIYQKNVHNHLTLRRNKWETENKLTLQLNRGDITKLQYKKSKNEINLQIKTSETNLKKSEIEENEYQQQLQKTLNAPWKGLNPLVLPLASVSMSCQQKKNIYKCVIDQDVLVSNSIQFTESIDFCNLLLVFTLVWTIVYSIIVVPIIDWNKTRIQYILYGNKSKRFYK